MLKIFAIQLIQYSIFSFCNHVQADVIQLPSFLIIVEGPNADRFKLNREKK